MQFFENSDGETPLVSVLMTAYNREQYIGEAIQSVIDSTYRNFELIITDDCSTDKTFLIAKEYEAKDSRIKVYKNKNNLKDYPNRNQAASYAIGKYIKYLDSDDRLFEDGLAYCVSAMEKFPEAGFGLLFFQKNYSGSEPVCWTSGQILRHHFLISPCLHVGPSGTIIRRAVFEKMQGFDTRFGVASDNYFNIKAATVFPVVLLPQDFFFYRVHDGQEIKDKYGYLVNNALYINEVFENIKLPLSKKEVEGVKHKQDKRFAKELMKYFLSSKSMVGVKTILTKTGYSKSKLIKAFFS